MYISKIVYLCSAYLPELNHNCTKEQKPAYACACAYVRILHIYIYLSRANLTKYSANLPELNHNCTKE